MSDSRANAFLGGDQPFSQARWEDSYEQFSRLVDAYKELIQMETNPYRKDVLQQCLKELLESSK